MKHMANLLGSLVGEPAPRGCNVYSYVCDRCGLEKRVAEDIGVSRRPASGDPLGQRAHDAPKGWVWLAYSVAETMWRDVESALICQPCARDLDGFLWYRKPREA